MNDDDLSPMQEAKRRFSGECDPNKRTIMLLDRVENVEKCLAVLIKEKPIEKTDYEDKPVDKPVDKPKMSVDERMKKAREAKRK